MRKYRSHYLTIISSLLMGLLLPGCFSEEKTTGRVDNSQQASTTYKRGSLEVLPKQANVRSPKAINCQYTGAEAAPALQSPGSWVNSSASTNSAALGSPLVAPGRGVGAVNANTIAANGGAGAAAQASAADGSKKAGGQSANDMEAFKRGDLMPTEQDTYGGDIEQERDSGGPYILGPGDKFKLSVEDHPEFSDEYTIQAEGSVELKLTNTPVMLRGLTVDQAKSAIGNELAKFVKNNPVITISVTYPVSRCYYVMGEVTNPGRFPIGTQEVRVSEAVFRANTTAFGVGYTENESIESLIKAETGKMPRDTYSLPMYADLSKVYLITPHRSHPVRQIVNIKKVLYQGKTGDDPVIRPGQIVFVPSSYDGRFVRFLERYIAPLNKAQEADNSTQYWYERLARERYKGTIK